MPQNSSLIVTMHGVNDTSSVLIRMTVWKTQVDQIKYEI